MSKTPFLVALTVAVSLVAPCATGAEKWDPEKALGVVITETKEGSESISESDLAALEKEPTTRAIGSFLFVTNLTPLPLFIARGALGKNLLGIVPPAALAFPIPVFDWAGDTKMWASTVWAGVPKGKIYRQTFHGTNVTAAWTIK